MIKKKMNVAKQIKVKYFNKELKPLTKIPKGDWIDMRAAGLMGGDEEVIRTTGFNPSELETLIDNL